MENTWGKFYTVEIFGASHETEVGVRIHLPLGTKIDSEQVQEELNRRKAKNVFWSTGRLEADEICWEGLEKNKVISTPLCARVENKNIKSKDYDFFPKLRPGHADYPAYVKYGKLFAGGGFFSGRMTVPLVIAGAVAKQFLKERGVEIVGQISKIGSEEARSFLTSFPNKKERTMLRRSDFPVMEPECASKGDSVKDNMIAEIGLAVYERDSVGSAVEVGVTGLPAGLGEPFFGSLESRIASLAFSVPGVKALEFGMGKNFGEMNGSKANDLYEIKEGKIVTVTNHNGGILGGLSTGMPLIFTVTFKPPSSIGRRQRTVTPYGEMAELTLEGRHDPVIAPRAVVVMEAVCAMALWDALLAGEETGWKK